MLLLDFQPESLSESLSKGASNEESFVAAAFETVLSRTPTGDERDACLKFLASGKRPVLLHALLNHHEFVTIR